MNQLAIRPPVSMVLFIIGLLLPATVLGNDLPGFKADQFAGKKPENTLLIKPEETDLSKVLSSEFYEISRYREKIKSDLVEAYELRNYKPVWFKNKKPKSLFKTFLADVENSYSHGFDPEEYQFTDLQAAYQKAQEGSLTEEELKELDMRMSANMLRFLYDLKKGNSNPVKKMGQLWFHDKKKISYQQQLARINNNAGYRKLVKAATPTHFHYAKLQESLLQYRKIAEEGGWPVVTLSGVSKLERGDNHEAVLQLRKRLLGNDKNWQRVSDTTLFDTNLEYAVRDFQERHGLTVDGVVGPATLEWMNVPVEEKIRLLTLNLERIRWMPADMGDNYLTINIPEYMFRAYEKDQVALKMRVIVGKEYTATPVFSDTLKYIVFSPTWTVPYSIKSKEMLPKLQRNPGHYGSSFKFYSGWSSNEVNPRRINWNNYSASDFPFNVVQQPGPNNALGLVKFIMPNSMHVYMHDTPTDHLFERTERAFSHGCIRLEQPAALAEYLLRDQPEWDAFRVDDYMHKESPVRIYPTDDYHVQISYLTAFVDEYGKTNFREDIYGYDKQQLRKISLNTYVPAVSTPE